MTKQFKDTTFGRAVRTGIQAFIVLAPLTVGILLLPEVQEFITNNVSWFVPLLAPVIAVVTYAYNYLQNRYGKSE